MNNDQKIIKNKVGLLNPPALLSGRPQPFQAGQQVSMFVLAR